MFASGMDLLVQGSFGYNFDLIGPKTNAIFAPEGLVVQYFEYGHWHELVALPEALHQCRDLPSTSDFLLVANKSWNPLTLF